MQIRSILLILLLTITGTAHSGVIIGLMGIGDQFDHSAFQKYADARGLNPIVLRANAVKTAVRIANQSSKYEIYAYSLGAASVHSILRKAENMPQRVITIGAYKTTDVNFSRYGIEFYNYFDGSGSGQLGPGIHLRDVSHWSIQRIVVDALLK